MTITYTKLSWQTYQASTFNFLRFLRQISKHLLPLEPGNREGAINSGGKKAGLVPARLIANVIDADHQNSCLFTNKGHFASPLWVLIGVLAKFHL